ENQLEALRQRSENGRFLAAARGRRCPGSLIILVCHCCAHSSNPSPGFRVAHQGFDSRPADPPHRREKGPLVWMRLELLVQKNGVSQLPRLLLQGQRNQVPEPAL